MAKGEDVAKSVDGTARALAEQMRETYRMRGILPQMAERGQLLEMRCEMPKCYLHRGARVFDPIGTTPDDWTPSADHYPTLKSRGGKLVPSNVRLGHKKCNRIDFQWRELVAGMLDSGASLSDIAQSLNAQHIERPHGKSRWTPEYVRKAITS